VSTIADLPDAQARAVESATKLCDPAWHDNIIDSIMAVLDGKSPPPWSNGTVQDAIKTALQAQGLDIPLF